MLLSTIFPPDWRDWRDWVDWTRVKVDRKYKNWTAFGLVETGTGCTHLKFGLVDWWTGCGLEL